MKKVKAGEKIDVEPGLSDAEIKKLNFDGSLRLTWDSESLIEFMAE